jgi:ATPase subunit of ABC transporter with duplicated ATPase domains
LDEPTNHLDVHALTWLEEFLLTWEKTVVIVSHDRGFLNMVTTSTIFVHRKRMWYYGGNYDTFLKVYIKHNQHVLLRLVQVLGFGGSIRWISRSDESTDHLNKVK